MALVPLLALCACAHKKVAVAPQHFDPYQTVRIDTPGVFGAECDMKTPAGVYHVKAPGFLTIKRSPYPVTVVCHKGNHFKGKKSVAPRYSALSPDGKCQPCNYPNTITVALLLNSPEMDRYQHLEIDNGKSYQ